MSGVKCTNNRFRKYFVTGILTGCIIALTGCGRVLTSDYESMRVNDQINPMVTSQTSSIRETSFASSLCLPEDVGAKGISLTNAGLFDADTPNKAIGRR